MEINHIYLDHIDLKNDKEYPITFCECSFFMNEGEIKFLWLQFSIFCKFFHPKTLIQKWPFIKVLWPHNPKDFQGLTILILIFVFYFLFSFFLCWNKRNLFILEHQSFMPDCRHFMFTKISTQKVLTSLPADKIQEIINNCITTVLINLYQNPLF